MGEEDGVGVGCLGTLGLGPGSASWVDGRGGSKLGRRAESMAAWVGGMGQGSGPVRVEFRGGLAVVRG